jgi:hypothetical protein
MQLFWSYNSRHTSFRFQYWMFCTFTSVLSEVHVQCPVPLLAAVLCFVLISIIIIIIITIIVIIVATYSQNNVVFIVKSCKLEVRGYVFDSQQKQWFFSLFSDDCISPLWTRLDFYLMNTLSPTWGGVEWLGRYYDRSPLSIPKLKMTGTLPLLPLRIYDIHRDNVNYYYYYLILHW